MKKNIVLIFINTLLLVIVIEVFLGFLRDFKMKKEYDKYIELKVKNKVYSNLSPEQVKGLYYEHIELQTKWSPYTHFELKKYTGKYNNIDSLGHRKTLSFYKDSSSSIKIFCFGGSTMYGIGTKDENTIPSTLAKVLKNKIPSKKFTITNFGLPGYTNDLEILQLRKELIKGNIPDIVIFYDGVNEVISAYQNNKIGVPFNCFNRKIEYNTHKEYLKKIRLFLKTSNIYNFIKYLKKKTGVNPNNVKDLIDNDLLSRQIVHNYKFNLTTSDSYAKSYNFKVFNFLQPIIFTNKKLSKYESFMAKNEKYYKKLFIKSYDLFKLDTTLNKNITFNNLSNIFNKINTEKTVYADFCHLVKEGNEIIAKNMANHIINHLNKNVTDITINETFKTEYIQ
ncbi:SGNH/GDSL hydrolase family protein [uncultured Tenacibaculum sp.]|uniref:SGNH/GDSL hydrolase family protein n=1 Tax=uncultured Tenacibaculum sp. TaxID=174713 RepID=UPI00260F4E4E|nr:SGNH/GDSL hydrolase family protein [uncultured Tenacibaculum sp.]